MAQRRMFSPQIVDSDAFLDMSPSAQSLYFHLGMRADDDGFVGNPRKILRMVGGNEDDLKILLAKRFILTFESGVIVIKHWRINNLVRKDWYRETVYVEEKKQLVIKDNGGYTELVNEKSPTRPRRLGKVSIGKVRIANTSDVPSQDIVSVIDSFKEVNQAYEKWYNNTTQRGAIERLLKIQTLEKILKVVNILPKTNSMPYMPSITTPLELEDRWSKLEASLIKKKVEITNKKPIVLL